MATVAAPAPEAPVSANSVSRLFNVLFAPKATFESIAQRPTWLLPLIILCALSAGVIATFSARGAWRSFMEKQDATPKMQQRMEQMTPDQRQEMIDKQVKFAPIFGYVGAVVFTFVGALIAAAVLLGVFNLMGGQKITFGASLGIVSYAWTPYIIVSILAIVILFLKDPTTVDLQNVVASNPGVFAGDDAPKWLVSLLSSLDLFTLWVLILLGFGYSATNPKKLSFGKAFTTVLAVWIIFVLIKVGFAAAFS
ncbi:MAG: Yip1 family protein [Candidatus Acidiferrales bacterium]